MDACVDSCGGARPKNILKVILAYLDCLNVNALNLIMHHLISQRKYGLLYFSVIVKGRRFRAMLDSGSSRDKIDAIVHKRLGLPTSRIPEYSLGLADA